MLSILDICICTVWTRVAAEAGAPLTGITAGSCEIAGPLHDETSGKGVGRNSIPRHQDSFRLSRDRLVPDGWPASRSSASTSWQPNGKPGTASTGSRPRPELRELAERFRVL